jgi:hypothetical protein
MNYITIMSNKRIIVIAIALSLHALTVLTAVEGGGGLASNIASAQSIPSNQGMASPPPLGPFPGQFEPPSPELSATQISASTNQTCTLTPSLIEEEGTPQQIEGPTLLMICQIVLTSGQIPQTVQCNKAFHCVLYFMSMT